MSDDIYRMITEEQAAANSSTPEAEAPFDKEAWAAEKQAERDQVYGRIDAATQRISDDPTEFRDYLDVMARFPRYSVANTLLIHDQSPEATRLGDFDSWKSRGASVKKGESAIAILEPGDEYTKPDGSIGISYNVKKVFDARQTSARHLEPRYPEIREALRALISNSPVAVKPVEASLGATDAHYDHATQTISIVKGLNEQELFKALVVEMAHAELAATEGVYDRDAQAEDAQLVGYVVAKRNGVDVSDRMPALSPCLEDGDLQDVRGQLGRVRDGAKEITDRMNKTLDADKGDSTKQKAPNRSSRDAR